MQEYSLLKIYTIAGQYDEVSNVTFKKGSESYAKYGEMITGDFHYTKEDRAALQKRLEDNDPNNEHGNVKFIERLSGDGEIVKELFENGFGSADIASILSFPKPGNEFIKKETRTLPKPLIVEFDARGFDAVKAILHLHKQKEKDGYRLTYFEIERDIAYQIIDNKYNIPEGVPGMFFNAANPGEISPAIRYQVVLHKLQYDELTAEEKDEFDKLISVITKEKTDVLVRELQRSTEKLKKVGITYKDTLSTLSYLIAFFEPEILLFSKFPVWWNLERFLHIFMRHVAEVKVGERFEEKTVFQYKL